MKQNAVFVMILGQISKRRCCFPECEDEFEDKQLLIDHILIEHRQKPVTGSNVVFNLVDFTPASIREVKEREDRIKQNSQLSQQAPALKPPNQKQLIDGHIYSSGARRTSVDTHTTKAAVSLTSDMYNRSNEQRKSDQVGRGNKTENERSRNSLSNNTEPSNLHTAKKEYSTKSSSDKSPGHLIGVRVISRNDQIRSNSNDVGVERTHTGIKQSLRPEGGHSIQDIHPKCTGDTKTGSDNRPLPSGISHSKNVSFHSLKQVSRAEKTTLVPLDVVEKARYKSTKSGESSKGSYSESKSGESSKGSSSESKSGESS